MMDFSCPKIMGIVNVSPDSFYQQSVAQTERQVVEQVEQMIVEGADIIDIGGQSTKPNSICLLPEEEIKRVQPILALLVKKFPQQIFSIDTFYSSVALACADIGADIVNDISGGTIDEKMFAAVAKTKLPYVCTHIQGTPQTMQSKTHYNDLCLEVIQFLDDKIVALHQLGVKDILIDVGIGFGKTIPQNFSLLQQLSFFQTLEKPLLIGLSRKSFIYKSLSLTPELALNGTTAMHMIALQNGANILRVHDVKEAKECITLFQCLNP